MQQPQPLGSTSLATDGSGNLAPDSLLRYFPYGGSRMGSEADAPTDYLFTGQRREQNLGGLIHMGARFYHPGLGRWISADTIVPDPANPQSLNRYSYGSNNPVEFRDPSGHQGEPVVGALQWGGAAMAGGTAALAVDLAVVGPVVLVGATGIAGLAGIGTAGVLGTAWVINGPLGPNYPLPEEFDPLGLGPTYPLPESSTVGIDGSMLFAMPKSVQSMADHLGFMFGYGAAGMPGFPDPFDRHDPKKPNYVKANARHIRNSLKGIKENLGKQDLQTYLQNALKEEQYASLTGDLDYLVADLQNQEWFYQQIGPELSSDIMGLLRDMGYILGP